MPEPRSVVIWTPEGVTLNSAKAYEVASLNDAFPLESFDLTYLIKAHLAHALFVLRARAGISGVVPRAQFAYVGVHLAPLELYLYV